MDSIEADGSSIDDAIARALARLGVSRDRVEIEILANATRGLFGFGGKRARVRATVRRPMALDVEPEIARPALQSAPPAAADDAPRRAAPPLRRDARRPTARRLDAPTERGTPCPPRLPFGEAHAGPESGRRTERPAPRRSVSRRPPMQRRSNAVVSCSPRSSAWPESRQRWKR